MTELSNFRKQLDKLDEQLMKLIKKRFQIIEKIAKHKKQNNIKIEQLDREKQIIENKIQKFSSKNLSKEFIENLFNLILKQSKLIQKNEK